ncbi:hypothetical protein D9V30_10235 [Mycetocola reblochoni]|uniref:Phage protein n=2 Tax=Mycetocola reblochoni TaxID=331618 RepID=A0A1R4JQ53_9MICO|nr:hypothetical protein [Mycetocola reblochoni]RLP68358.1 hypothetical protein D9V30_10235 [Mycetocola reblochoni]SJN34128.1 hypothetical protein FM119_08780 [Mycetocola reblochoni REB411]
MAKATVTAPVAGFTGSVAGVTFADGKAEGEIPQAALSYFERQGYTVEVKPARKKADPKADEGKPAEGETPPVAE